MFSLCLQHQGEEVYITGQCKYVNIGSAGCNDKPEVRIGILEITDTFKFESLSIKYEDNGLIEVFDERNVPVRDSTWHIFKV